jgi:hypothetical protein
MVKIYLITNCFNDSNKVYIGKTKNYIGQNKNSRKNSHKKTFGKDIIYDYIDEIESSEQKDWEPLETYWIQQFRAWGFEVLNKNKGGGGCDYHKPEAILKIKTATENREYLPEWGKKVSIATKGKKKNHPPDRGINISKAKKGKPNPKLIESRTGKPHPKKGWPVTQLDKFGNIIKNWDDAPTAGAVLNIAPDLIRTAANGKQKTAGGFKWEWTK